MKASEVAELRTIHANIHRALEGMSKCYLTPELKELYENARILGGYISEAGRGNSRKQRNDGPPKRKGKKG